MVPSSGLRGFQCAGAAQKCEGNLDKMHDRLRLVNTMQYFWENTSVSNSYRCMLAFGYRSG